MNIRVTWRIATIPLTLAGLSVVPLMGCDKVSEAQQSLCCSEFTPGADLAAVEWGLDGDAEVNYGVFMQSVSDFTGVAGAMVTDVTNACRAIALDLGADPAEVTATEPGARATAWCDLAIGQLGDVAGNVSITFQPPRCTIDASVQANCEAKCGVTAECQLTPAQIAARCDPGKLSGRCTAMCTGRCEGSANLAVECQGRCDGTCEGTCEGTWSGAEGRSACDGACDGQCRGSCEIEAEAGATCSADCTGGCSVEYQAPKCTAELAAPELECDVDAKCSGSCEASASARADCKEPSLDIVATGDVDLSAKIATLRANLPRLLVVAKARGQLLADNAEAVFNAAANVEVTGSVKAGACIIPATNAITQAVENITASLDASVKVMGTLEIQ